MLDQGLEREIVRHLGQGRRPDELVPIVCERTGLKWDAAKREVLNAQSRHQDIIARRRRRTILISWLPLFLWSGFAVIGNLVFFLIHPLDYLKESIKHPAGHLLLGEAILVFGGGLLAIFRKKPSPQMPRLPIPNGGQRRHVD
jgi:hypothetical protein